MFGVSCQHLEISVTKKPQRDQIIIRKQEETKAPLAFRKRKTVKMPLLNLQVLKVEHD